MDQLNEIPDKWKRNEQGLLPCPFCFPGNSIVELVELEGINDKEPYYIFGYRVGCGACGASTGHCHRRVFGGLENARRKAIDSWNTRDGFLIGPPAQ